MEAGDLCSTRWTPCPPALFLFISQAWKIGSQCVSWNDNKNENEKTRKRREEKLALLSSPLWYERVVVSADSSISSAIDWKSRVKAQHWVLWPCDLIIWRRQQPLLATRDVTGAYRISTFRTLTLGTPDRIYSPLETNTCILYTYFAHMYLGTSRAVVLNRGCGKVFVGVRETPIIAGLWSR